MVVDTSRNMIAANQNLQAQIFETRSKKTIFYVDSFPYWTWVDFKYANAALMNEKNEKVNWTTIFI